MLYLICGLTEKVFFLAQTIHTELSKLVKKYSDHRGVEQAMYKKMLGNTSSNSDRDEQSKSWVRIFISFCFILGSLLNARVTRSWGLHLSATSTLSPLHLPGPQLEVAVRFGCRGHRWRSIICLHSCQELRTFHCDDVTIPQQWERLKHRSTSASGFWTSDNCAASFRWFSS